MSGGRSKRNNYTLRKETKVERFRCVLQTCFVLFRLFVSVMICFLKWKRPKIIVAACRQIHHELAGNWRKLQHSVASMLLVRNALQIPRY